MGIETRGPWSGSTVHHRGQRDNARDRGGSSPAAGHPDNGGLAAELAVLSGEGGREGLILIVSRHFNDDPQARWGVIVPSDKVPPTPDKQQLLHDGERDDAGLVALLEFTEQKKSRGNRRPSQQDVHGFIVDGDIPPVPVSASAE